MRRAANIGIKIAQLADEALDDLKTGQKRYI
jgi:hypothetical protein